jgi:putative intracellular protease/amidase
MLRTPSPVASETQNGRITTIGAPDSVHTFGFLLVPDFSMIAFTSALEPLRLANRCCGKQVYGWRLFSPDGQPVAASNGVTVAVDGAYADVGPMPAVVVCAGLDVHRFDHRELIAKLRTLAFYGVSIGAVCTGTYVLAKAGLLSGPAKSFPSRWLGRPGSAVPECGWNIAARMPSRSSAEGRAPAGCPRSADRSRQSAGCETGSPSTPHIRDR